MPDGASRRNKLAVRTRGGTRMLKAHKLSPPYILLEDINQQNIDHQISVDPLGFSP